MVVKELTKLTYLLATQVELFWHGLDTHGGIKVLQLIPP